MENIVSYNKVLVDDMSKDILEDFITTGQPFYFEYQDRDYLVEAFSKTGYIIVDPFPYYADGGWPDKMDFAHPYHKEAKTADQFLNLEFLDGKTIFDRFDDLRFFDISPIYEE